MSNQCQFGYKNCPSCSSLKGGHRKGTRLPEKGENLVGKVIEIVYHREKTSWEIENEGSIFLAPPPVDINKVISQDGNNLTTFGYGEKSTITLLKIPGTGIFDGRVKISFRISQRKVK